MVGGGGGRGGGGDVGVGVGDDAELAPHDLPVAGEGADVFVFAGLGGRGHAHGFLLAGLDHPRGAEHVGVVVGHIGAALFVEFGGEVRLDGLGHFLPLAGLYDHEVVRHTVQVLEDDLERLARFHDELRDVVAHLLAHGFDDENADAEAAEFLAEALALGLGEQGGDFGAKLEGLEKILRGALFGGDGFRPRQHGVREIGGARFVPRIAREQGDGPRGGGALRPALDVRGEDRETRPGVFRAGEREREQGGGAHAGGRLGIGERGGEDGLKLRAQRRVGQVAQRAEQRFAGLVGFGGRPGGGRVGIHHEQRGPRRAARSGFGGLFRERDDSGARRRERFRVGRGEQLRQFIGGAAAMRIGALERGEEFGHAVGFAERGEVGDGLRALLEPGALPLDEAEQHLLAARGFGEFRIGHALDDRREDLRVLRERRGFREERQLPERLAIGVVEVVVALPLEAGVGDLEGAGHVLSAEEARRAHGLQAHARVLVARGCLQKGEHLRHAVALVAEYARGLRAGAGLGRFQHAAEQRFIHDVVPLLHPQRFQDVVLVSLVGLVEPA